VATERISIGELVPSSRAFLRTESFRVLREVAVRELRQGVRSRGGYADVLLTIDGRPGARQPEINRAEKKIIIDFEVSLELKMARLLAAIESQVYGVVTRRSGRLGTQFLANVFRGRGRPVVPVSSAATVRLSQGDNLRLIFAAKYAPFVSARVAARSVVATALRGRSKRLTVAADDTIRVTRADLKRRSLAVQVARALNRLPFMRLFLARAQLVRGAINRLVLNVKLKPSGATRRRP
jgi:hypothetical protein